jgi:hypothetical protein
LSRRPTYTAHRFDRIHDQVQHHPLQLYPIADDGRPCSRRGEALRLSRTEHLG